MDVSTLVNLVAHKNSEAKTLLLGSQNTERILVNSPLLYCKIAEISNKAFAGRQELASKYKNVSAQQMDPSVLLEEQIPVDETYDLIITSEGLQTSDMFRDVHKHLSHSGRFVLEKTSAGAASAQSLNASGFFDIDFESSNFVLSTVVKADHFTAVDTLEQKILLIYRRKADKLVAEVEAAAKGKGWVPRISELESCEVRAGEHVVFLADLEGPLLATLEENDLRVLQHISSKALSILWVTMGDLIRGGKPEYAMTTGLARSLTSENALLNLITLDLELGSTAKVTTANVIVAVTETQLQRDSSHESEYYLGNGAAHISRLEPLEDLNLTFSEKELDPEHLPCDLSAPLSGKVHSGNVSFEADSHVDEALPVNEIEVRVSYAGLDKEGVVIINGTDYPTMFSHEIYGKVTRVGTGVEDLHPGDLVFEFSFVNFATVQRTPSSLVQKVDEKGLPEELGTLPMSYATALHGLGNLEEDDIILILHGTGAAGLAALGVCHWLKDKPYIVVESQAEAEMMKSEYQLTEEQIIFSSVASIPTQLSDLTGGHGADVVFSSVSTDSNIARECWGGIASSGRFVDIGRKNVFKRSVLDSLPLHHGAS